MSEFLSSEEIQDLKTEWEIKAALHLLCYKLYSLRYTNEELELAEDIANWLDARKRLD